MIRLEQVSRTFYVGGRPVHALREVDLTTGNVRRAERLDDRFFGEGLALAGDSLWQLTWQSGVAIHYDLDSFGRIEIVRYEGEGWGLCHDGERLVMSDGSDTLFFRDSETFALEDDVAVTLDGAPVTRLNELECVGRSIWANVWQTDHLVEIDPFSGRVLTVVDATNLLSPAERRQADVLNGIAWDEEAGTFLLTGKLWPRLFEVTFEETAGNDPSLE